MGVITSTSNPRIQWVRTLQRRRAAREQEGVFVVEGVRLAEEAHRAGAIPRLLLHVEPPEPRLTALVARFAARGTPVVPVSERVFKACSAAETPQGILLVVAAPELPEPEHPTLLLIVDGLADPGNLGTLLRTAHAAGVDEALICAGAVDAYNPKVVRAAMGAHFRLPLRVASAEAILDRVGALPLWLAVPRGGIRPDELDGRQPLGLIVGGEARGPRPQWRSRAAGSVSIPMASSSESLNAAVAAAVILFEVRRQRGAP